MLILLTEDSGYETVINTDFLVSATVEKTQPPKDPVYTVVTLADGCSIRVHDDPGEILDATVEQSMYLDALFNPEDEYDDEPQDEEDNQVSEVSKLKTEADRLRAINTALREELALSRIAQGETR